MADDTFRLSDEEHRRVFDNICSIYLGGLTPSKTPRAIILGGQPGCGKSTMIPSCIQEFPDKNVVVINGDDFRSYHPRYNEILQRDESRMAELTDPDTRAWTKALFDKAIERRLNIIFEGTLRESGPISETLSRLHENGYSNSLYLKAAHERESLLYIHHRFEGQKEHGRYGRKVPIPIHDAAYRQMPETAAKLEKEGLVDNVLVRDCNDRIIYHNEQKDGIWKEPPHVAEAIQSGRERPWTQEEKDLYQHNWDSLLKKMEARWASEKEFDEIEGVKKRCFNAWEQDTSHKQNIASLNPADLNEIESATALLKNPRAMDNSSFKGHEISSQQNDTLDLIEQVRKHVQADKDAMAKLQSAGLAPEKDIAKNKIVRPGQFPHLKGADVVARTKDSLTLIKGRNLFIYELKKLELKAPAQGVPGETLDIRWPERSEKAGASIAQAQEQKHNRSRGRSGGDVP